MFDNRRHESAQKNETNQRQALVESRTGVKDPVISIFGTIFASRPSASRGVEKNKKKLRKIAIFGMDLGWFGGALGTVWGYFRDDFGPILKNRKSESSELKN